MTAKEWILSNWDRILERAKTKEKAVGFTGCAYRVNWRAEDTRPENCCFLGWLIPPDRYKQDTEQMFPGEIPHLIDESAPVFTGDDEMILVELQKIHDNSDPSYWDTNLAQFKEQYLT